MDFYSSGHYARLVGQNGHIAKNRQINWENGLLIEIKFLYGNVILLTVEKLIFSFMKA